MQQQGSSQSKAFVTFDGLFSILPALLILLFSLNAAHHLTKSASEQMHNQEVFDKIVSIADYVVKQGAVKTGSIGSEEVRYPNWIESSNVNSNLEHSLQSKTRLASLSIQFDKPGSESTCIYRIVLDEKEEIRKLYVCGE
jgi:hypothetical protein